MVWPFLQRSDIRVRLVSLAELASEISEQTWLVAFSFAQSVTGEIADTDTSRLVRGGLGVGVVVRTGRLRAAFHLWNDESDLAAVVTALGR